MSTVTALQRRRKTKAEFSRLDPDFINVKRRKEIEAHARHVGAADSEDFSQWLIAWVWQNPRATDQVWSLMEAARRMGGKLTETEAEAIIEEASNTRRHRTADRLARWLGLKYDTRNALGITTIGSTNINKREREEIRRIKNKVAKERKRRERGARPRDEFEANSVAAKARQEGVSRMTIYRRRKAEQAKNKPDVTGLRAEGSKRTYVSRRRPSCCTRTLPWIWRHAPGIEADGPRPLGFGPSS